jgi:hypothetical protein
LRAAIALAAGLFGCSEPAPQPRWLTLRQIRPENREGVFLNERLVLHFSEPLERASVHPRSVRVVSSDGLEARGRLAVEGDRIEFVPAPVLSRELSDGGYRPGTRYSVELAGFPRPDALRGASGAPLRQNLRWSFATAVRGDERAQVFEDPSPQGGLPLVVASPSVRPLEPIVITCAEPVDPSTLHSEDFELEGRKSGATVAIPVLARLVRNDEPAAPGEPAAVIQLVPLDRVLEVGNYGLPAAERGRSLRLRDFGGHPLRILFRPGQQRVIRVEGPAAGDLGTVAAHVETFLDPRTRSTQAVAGADGTAYWGDSGRVEVRWPAAAGDGRDGEAMLAGARELGDLQALRATVPAGATCELPAAPGPVLLRAQGRIRIEGTLRRRGDDLGGGAGSPAVAEDALQRLRGARTLTELVERVSSAAIDVTLVIAGGDLEIAGRIETDRALVLVAGGRIRWPRGARLTAAHVAVVEQGFATPTFERPGRDAGQLTAERLELELDPPAANALAAPLRFAVVSTSMPPDGRAERWLPRPEVHAHPGSGGVRVRYIGEHAPGGPAVRDVIVDDPAALVGCPTLRLQIELTVRPPWPWRAPWERGPSAPSSRWDPPWVDDVLLSYLPARAAGR